MRTTGRFFDYGCCCLSDALLAILPQKDSKLSKLKFDVDIQSVGAVILTFISLGGLVYFIFIV